MTIRHVVWRTVRHYRGSSFAVVAGLAVATAVITGSLIIGSSLRGSLFDLSLLRLGGVNHAALLPRPMSVEITTGTAALPMLRTTGTATPALGEPRPEPVTVWGVDEKTQALLQLPPPAEGVLINEALARDLQITAGDEIALSVNRPRAIGMDSLFARRKLADVMATLQLPITAILPDNGPGDFRLDGQSARPRNVFLGREALARVLELQGKANVLVAAAGPSAHDLNAAVAKRLTLADQGLHLRVKPRTLSLTSDTFTLTEAQFSAASRAKAHLGASAHSASAYLATTIRAPNGRETAYAIVAGGIFAQQLGLTSNIDDATQDWIALNAWAAQDLQAKPGDKLTLEYLVHSPDGTFPRRSRRVPLVGIIPISGIAADPYLVPEYEGLTDADSMGDWKPPFPIDLGRVTARDEAYWQKYRTVPKAFVEFNVIDHMWGRPDHWTSVEITPPSGQSPTAFGPVFERELLKVLQASQPAIIFRDVAQTARHASAGTTDFSQLFLALSMFIIAAGIGLAAMLVRLGVERRTDQIGLLLAVGMDDRRIRKLLLAEGTILNLGGMLLGLPLGTLYAGALTWAMSAYWRVALGDAPALWLHVRVTDLLIGAVSGLLIGHLSIQLSLRGLRRLHPVQLWQYGLRHEPMAPARRGAGHPIATLAIMLALAAGLIVLGLGGRAGTQAVTFFGAGAFLLGAAFPALSLSLSGGRGRTVRRWTALAWRNASLHLRRSQLVFGLIAAASFVLVATAASTRNWGLADVYDRNSGTGGYNLIATSTVPLPYDPGTPAGRRNLGFADADEAILSRCEIVSMLAGPGDDLSCMSASNPGAPRLLARPAGLKLKTDRNPRFQSPPRTDWPNVPIPAVGDADTVLWRLHLKLGAVWETQDAFGRPLKLWIEGLLHRSVLAGYLLIEEGQFRRLYPEVTAPSVFLIRTSPENEASVMAALRRTLGDLGLQVRPAREVLAEYAQAQNVYISMFLSLGALGLLLGTVGLAVVTVRNIVERRQELALLAATGFSERRLVALLLLEHGGLAGLGLLAGAVAALVAMVPQLAAADSSVNWLGLGVALATVLVAGLGANVVAIRRSLRRDLIEGLRHE